MDTEQQGWVLRLFSAVFDAGCIEDRRIVQDWLWFRRGGRVCQQASGFCIEAQVKGYLTISLVALEEPPADTKGTVTWHIQEGTVWAEGLLLQRKWNQPSRKRR